MNDRDVANMVLSQINTSTSIGTFTWLNHYSARVNAINNIDVTKFTFVGVDGQFLAYLLAKGIKTTSADRVLPLLLKERIRVTCIGGSEKNAFLRREILKHKFPDIELVGNYDGYSTNLMQADFVNNLRVGNPQLIIIGTGSPLQEHLTIEIERQLSSSSLDHGLSIVTCGGWLDQILVDSYYPKWSYRYRVNWLVRLAREPLRLWKRYSIDAAIAVLKFRQLRKNLRQVVS
jgi:exopolysaccharide biosynthesis WecB/TagA/CpsF family protein